MLGGVVGMTVDAASGTAMDHKPNPITYYIAAGRSAVPTCRKAFREAISEARTSGRNPSTLPRSASPKKIPS